MGRVIVTDGRYRMAIPVIRRLSQKGHTIVCTEEEQLPKAEALGFYSKHTAQTAYLPREDASFCAAVTKLCRQGERPVIIPVGRKTLGLLAAHPELSGIADFLVPSSEALEWADDKARALQAAREAGARVPHTAYLPEAGGLSALADKMPYPCVVKYRAGEALGLKPAQRYRIVKSKETFLNCYAEMDAKQPSPLAQEYIEGEGLGASLLLDKNGALVDFICHRRLREYPVTGGPSCLCQAIFDRKLLETAYAILKKMNFQGVAMVEFKGSIETPVFMEVNPRFWGTSPLVAAADGTFYESIVQAATGQSKPLDVHTCLPSYRVGTKMRFTPQDLLALPGYLKKGNRGRVLWEYVRDFFNFNIRDGLFCWNDSAPYFRYLKNTWNGRRD